MTVQTGNSEHLEVLNQQAIALFNEGKHQEALTRFNQLLGIAPQNSTINCSAGVVQWHLGQKQEALKRLEAALIWSPRDLMLITTLVQMYCEQGRIGDATKCCIDFLAKGHDPAVEQVLAQVRKLQPAVARPERLKHRHRNADALVNQLEAQWWEKYAELMAGVWELHDEIRIPVRSAYLTKARDFFLKGQSRARVLELGCGNGWVGQMIAGPNLSVVGSDFSSNQIRLAQESAARRGLNSYCSYSVQSSGVLPNDMQSYDGVLLHCFLHHLDGNEIDTLLSAIKSQVRKGTKIWVHEPAFYVSPPACPEPLNPRSQALFDQTNNIIGRLAEFCRAQPSFDSQTYTTFQTIFRDAEEKGWYLSPKEVPFEIDDFSRTLAQNFNVQSNYWANIYIIGWVHEMNLVQDPNVRSMLAKLILPTLVATDKLLSQELGYLRGAMLAPMHSFHAWECIA